jgi:pimeloyl-ACP methyl ester carboxylesterase
MDTLLPGITAERMPTSRLTVAVLSVPGRTGPAVLFVHGNVSSSLFWQPTMLALPEPYRPLAIDLRGFGETDPEPVDATRGLRDYADDLAAAIDALGLDSVHLVGWSMGGGVVLQYLTDRSGQHGVASLTLVDPVSPFGFGGTKGVDGMLCDPQGAGSGGGAANPEFVERLAAPADGGADPRRAGRVRGGRRAVPRGRDRGRRPRPAPGPAGAIPRRADRSPVRLVSVAKRSAGLLPRSRPPGAV